MSAVSWEWSFNTEQLDPNLIRLFTGEDPEPRQERAVLIQYDVPISLRTGKRGRTSKAEHARRLKLARLKRRIARREKRPAGVVKCQAYFPRVWIDQTAQAISMRVAPGA